ncbi:MAG TPA: NADH-quinone oxidoreductase subunit C [Planctomycetota bacterium]
MQAPARDTGWGPMQVHFEAARLAAAAFEAAGIAVQLHEPNLPVFAEEGESKRLAKKAKDGGEREWRGDSFLKLADRGQLLAAMRILRDDLGYEQVIDVTGVDYDAEDANLWGVYCLLSLRHKARLTVKVDVPKDDCWLDSIVSLYSAANWHERESSEFFGIVYRGHPDPRHVLLPDDWVGFPLRKDYEFPDEYHGISCN